MDKGHIKTRTLSPAATGIEFEIHDVANTILTYGEEVTSPQRADFYEMIWIASGSGAVILDGTIYPFGPNTVFFVQPGQVKHISAANKPQGVIICFRESFLYDEQHHENLLLRYNLLNTAYEQPNYTLDVRASEALNGLIRAVQFEYSQPANIFGHLSSLQHLFQLILILVQRAAHIRLIHSLDITNHDNRIWIRFLQLQEKHYREGWTIQQYATALAVSPKTLTRACKASAALTPTQSIAKRQTTEAMRLLQYSSHNLSQIAAYLHFNNTSNFTKFFRVHTGMTPTEYRKSMCF